MVVNHELFSIIFDRLKIKIYQPISDMPEPHIITIKMFMCKSGTNFVLHFIILYSKIN